MRQRKSNTAKYYYTPGGEFRSVITGDEYIGPYFVVGGFVVSGYDADSGDGFNLVDFSQSKESILYKKRFQKYDDKAAYPEPYRPFIKPGLTRISRTWAYDRLTERFFEVKPTAKKYYEKDKPLRKRYLVASLKWTLTGANAVNDNRKEIAESPFPGLVKDLYLDPTDLVT